MRNRLQKGPSLLLWALKSLQNGPKWPPKALWTSFPGLLKLCLKWVETTQGMPLMLSVGYIKVSGHSKRWFLRYCNLKLDTQDFGFSPSGGRGAFQMHFQGSSQSRHLKNWPLNWLLGDCMKIEWRLRALEKFELNTEINEWTLALLKLVVGARNIPHQVYIWQKFIYSECQILAQLWSLKTRSQELRIACCISKEVRIAYKPINHLSKNSRASRPGHMCLLINQCKCHVHTGFFRTTVQLTSSAFKHCEVLVSCSDCRTE